MPLAQDLSFFASLCQRFRFGPYGAGLNLAYRLGIAMVAVSPVAAHAEEVRMAEVGGFDKLLEGQPDHVAIFEDGSMALGLQSTRRFMDVAQAFGAWARVGDRFVAARLGDTCEVVTLSFTNNEATIAPLYTPKAHSLVTKIYAYDDDTVIIATAHPASLTAVDTKGHARVLPLPEVSFVWDLTKSPDGGLYAATGEPGGIAYLNRASVLRPTHTSARADMYFVAPEAHIKSLSLSDTGDLYAGGGQKGLVYWAAAHTPMRALWDSGHTEITALLSHGDGVVAAAVTGGQGAPAADDKPLGAMGKTLAEVRSQVVRLGTDGSIETLAGSVDEVVFALAPASDGRVLLATGAVGEDEPFGRVYSVDVKNHRIALVYQAQARRITHLLPGNEGQWHLTTQAATSVVTLQKDALAQKRSLAGTYTTRAFDAQVTSKFGRVEVLGHTPVGTHIKVALRSGNTRKPDVTWGAWSQPVTMSALTHASPTVDGARFVQAKILFESNDARKTPEIWGMRLAFLRQNVAPFIRDMSWAERGVAYEALPRGMGQDDVKAKMASLGDKAPELSQSEGVRPRGPTRVRLVQRKGAQALRWLADDANGDELRFSLWLKRVDAEDWHLVFMDRGESFYSFGPGQLADGHYVFRVTASDSPSNPQDVAKSDTKISRPFLIDNTAPTISLRASQKGNTLVVKGEAHDDASIITTLQWSLNGQQPRPIAVDDGLLDGPTDSFMLRIGPLVPGHHTLVVLARDEAGNEASQQVSLKL